MNVQELQTIVGYQLPVKIFVLNNGGYLSIRQTQTGFFQGRKIGESPESGVTFPKNGKDSPPLMEYHRSPSKM